MPLRRSTPLTALISSLPLGMLHASCKATIGRPLQATEANGIVGIMPRAPASIAGRQDLERGSPLLLVYYVHLVQDIGCTVTPRVDNPVHGSVCTPIRRNAMDDRAPVSLA